MTVVALVVIVTTVNLEQMQETVRSANPWWALAAFGLGATGWLGATFVFMAFAPTKLPFRKSLYVQVASSFVALAAPAGIGPATLNLRMLTQRGVKTSVAVATVALVQVSQFVVTVVVLILLSAVSGNGGVLRTIPSATVLIALCSVAVAAGLVMAIPQLRKWLLSKITPTLAVVWPRVSDLLSQPGRLTLGIFGNILVTLSNILAFWAALTAFGQSLELVDIAVIYLLANSAGSAVPTPGGLGAIETTLIFGLTTMARLPAPIATSAVVLFRIMTYWARIPFGWIAMKNLQKHNDI